LFDRVGAQVAEFTLGLTFPYFRVNRLRGFACVNLSTRVLSVGW